MSEEWPPARVAVGDWVALFETACEVLEVRESDTFRARRLLLRTADAQLHTTLVPLDYEPMPVIWQRVAAVGTGGSRRWIQAPADEPK